MSIPKRIGSGAILCLPILFQSTTAMAVENNAPSSASSDPRASGDWSVTAGIGFDGPNYGYEYYSRTGPAWGLTLEYRLSRHTWMLFGTSVQYHTNVRGSDAQGYNGGWAWIAEGHTGLRYVFNPGKVFELSSYVIMGGFDSRFDQFSQRSSSTGAEGTFGISVDRELIHGVGVRVSSSFASSGWAQTRMGYTNTPTRQEEAGFYAAIGLQPTVELRMTF